MNLPSLFFIVNDELYESQTLQERLYFEVTSARIRLDFYGARTAVYRLWVLILNVFAILLPISGGAVWLTQVTYSKYISSSCFLALIVVVLIRMRLEKRQVLFNSATIQAGDQWNDWAGLLDQTTFDGVKQASSTMRDLRAKDRKIFNKVVAHQSMKSGSKEKVSGR